MSRTQLRTLVTFGVNARSAVIANPQRGWISPGPMMNLDFPEHEAFFDDEGLSRLSPVELIGCLRALQAEKARLQALVCDLLSRNERLRCPNSIDERAHEYE
jgi:hypothetical protein